MRFSIVIPTRNRADSATAALQSVLHQAGGDFEVIVSDNSTDAAASAALRAAVAALADPRVRLIRPAEPLAMHAHWEFATAKAQGDYLLILTDRFAIRPGVLTALTRLIRRHDPDILTWTTEATLAADGRFVETASSGTVRERTALDVLTEFASCRQWRSSLLGTNSLPRGLNSAVRREIVEAVRAEGRAFYAALSPDYTSAFHQLARGQSVLEIDRALYVGHGEVSNGAQSLRIGAANFADQFELDIFERCPLRIDTVVNTTIRDYLWVDAETGLGLPSIDPVGYLLINWRELQVKRELGSRLDIAGMARTILDAAEKLPPDQRAAFAEGRALIDARETRAYRLRNQLARLGVLDPLKTVVGALRRPSGPRYRNVLEAIEANPLPPLAD